MFKTEDKLFQYSSITDNQMPFGKSSWDYTLEDFLDTEQVKRPSYINAATLSGAFIIVSTIGLVLFQFDFDLGLGSIYTLPFLGGILLLLAAFSSRFIGEKKPKKKNRNKTNEDVFGGQHYSNEFLRYDGFETENNQSVHYSNHGVAINKNKSPEEFNGFGSGESESFSSGHIKNDDNISNSERGRTNAFQEDSTTYSWDYFQQKRSKRLYKSRHDKKLWGVCGGLADFFGIGTIWIRSIFVVAFFMGWGSSFLIYVAFSLILNKEPLNLDYPEKW
tara:strand:+ start:4582 stop:5409 length:828 start_codon:yes stop_codon:yes gene_type:complete